jgi:hypothetical protein
MVGSASTGILLSAAWSNSETLLVQLDLQTGSLPMGNLSGSLSVEVTTQLVRTTTIFAESL